MKINPLGNEMFHAEEETQRQTGGKTDRQTDITKLILAFFLLTLP
jgi:hypothetical protein